MVVLFLLYRKHSGGQSKPSRAYSRLYAYGHEVVARV